MKLFARRAGPAPLRAADVAYVADPRSAALADPLRHASWALYLMLLMVAAAIGWAALTRVDDITRADGRVVPEGREQVIASLEGGILRELYVHEGMQVDPGQALAQIDPTRFESQQKESEIRRLSLQATRARLMAEAGDEPLDFPKAVAASPALVAAETEAYEARRRALEQALNANQRSIDLLQREKAMSEAMAAKGLLSDVEVMRLARQVNELQLQSQERTNRFRQDASTDLVRVQSELAQLDEQMNGRADVLRRTVLTSPVHGLVKNIRTSTLGGVIGPGAPVMEIVPLGSKVLIEARIKPADIGFVRVGQIADVKLSAYDYATYGALKGTVEYISPDALGDADRAPSADATYYRALVRADSALMAHGKPLAALPGMTGSVEVRTGERSVLDFLLRPVLKSKEAFREG
ncbi:MAG: HlyD family type I secretion periplasmic adaptor subunit [Proteobacteria bacterium]|nr:HlyD family type I secretion periplasmic adaptor subunit [Pseudomonadota bacterium]